MEIVLRADSGFAREGLVAGCEENGVDYVFGLGRNRRLVERIDAAFAGAERDACLSGHTARSFADFSWSPLFAVERAARFAGSASSSRLMVSHHGSDGLSDALGGGLDFPITEMSVTQRHADVGVTEHP